jgi:hypothetical protein
MDGRIQLWSPDEGSTSLLGNRFSRFADLRGFLRADEGKEITAAYDTGASFHFADVGEIYYINHEWNKEIHQKVVVIFRTNNDSWSCYEFCKHPVKHDCEKQAFKEEHVKVVANMPPRQSRNGDMSSVVLELQDGLEVQSDIWINCRRILDIKHTVNVAAMGWVGKDCLGTLLQKGRDVFIQTYADRDKKRYASSHIHSPAV